MVLLYTHNDESLSLSLTVTFSPCWFALQIKTATKFTQRNHTLSLAHSFVLACNHQTFQHCASVCMKTANWTKYVIYACGNFWDYWHQVKNGFMPRYRMKSRCVNAMLRVAELQNDIVKLSSEENVLRRGIFDETEFLRARNWANIYVWFILRNHGESKVKMSGGRKREDHICIVLPQFERIVPQWKIVAMNANSKMDKQNI